MLEAGPEEPSLFKNTFPNLKSQQPLLTYFSLLFQWKPSQWWKRKVLYTRGAKITTTWCNQKRYNQFLDYLLSVLLVFVEMKNYLHLVDDNNSLGIAKLPKFILCMKNWLNVSTVWNIQQKVKYWRDIFDILTY